MEHKIAETNARIDVADVLRGLAVMGINGKGNMFKLQHSGTSAKVFRRTQGHGAGAAQPLPGPVPRTLGYYSTQSSPVQPLFQKIIQKKYRFKQKQKGGCSGPCTSFLSGEKPAPVALADAKSGKPQRQHRPKATCLPGREDNDRGGRRFPALCAARGAQVGKGTRGSRLLPRVIRKFCSLHGHGGQRTAVFGASRAPLLFCRTGTCRAGQARPCPQRVPSEVWHPGAAAA